jgi:hypothetical protein
MNLIRNESGVRRYVLFALVTLIAAFAMAQHKNAPSAPRPSAPAPHASAPAHTSAPSHPSAPTQHTTTPSHTNTQSRTTPSSTGHTTAATPSRTGTSTVGHTNTTLNGHTNTTVNGRTGTTTTGHTNTAVNARTNTTVNGRTGTNNTTKTAGTAGRPGTMTAGKAGGAAKGSGSTTTGRATMSHTPPGRQVSLKGGGTAHIRPNGQIRTVNRNGMQIQHNLHGGRTIVSTHNGARVVTTGRHGGYVQRSYVTRGGHSYYSRTYYYHGEYRTGIYRGYYYGGRPYYGYYPAYYYGSAYYGWAYNPWPAPVYYGWGWGGAPWYGYYGGYFAPYPVYPSAAFWLTDYLISVNLQAAYAAQAEAEAGTNLGYPAWDQLVASMGAIPAADTANAVALSPELKKAISEEIKAQLAAEQTQAGSAKSSSEQGAAPANSNEAPPALDPARRVFVVSADLSVVADGEECALTAGDVITRLTDKPDDDNNVNVSVSASKKTDCAPGKQVAVSVDDLQEMHNHFREQLTSGMGELAKKQGKDGLPKAPDTTTTAGDVPAPPADKSAAKTLEDQEKAADQTESEVKQEAGSSGGGSQ